MCLKKVECIYARPLYNVSIGYKYFDLIDNQLYSVYKNNSMPFRVGIWIHDDNKTPISSEQKFRSFTSFGCINQQTILNIDYKTIKYPPGFHIFETHADARLYDVRDKDHVVLLKVKYTNIVACGKDYSDSNCIIARSMLIVPNQLKKCKKH